LADVEGAQAKPKTRRSKRPLQPSSERESAEQPRTTDPTEIAMSATADGADAGPSHRLLEKHSRIVDELRSLEARTGSVRAPSSYRISGRLRRSRCRRPTAPGCSVSSSTSPGGLADGWA
jgi:hypothetical protein